MAQALSMKAFNFKKNTVLITGGTSGIGLTIAREFAKSGATVIIIGRDKSKLKTAQGEISKLSTCVSFAVDVSKKEAITKVVKLVVKKFKKIDILVNCAGVYGPIGEFHTNDLNSWQEALSINLLGTVFTSQSVLPFMLKQKKGKIINLSGGGAVKPFPNFSAYAVSKAAVVRFTESLAYEYKEYNIQINAIAPGAVNTSFLERVLAAKEKAGKNFYQKSLEQKRTGGDSPIEAAKLVLFLSTPVNTTTGKIISAKWDPWKKDSFIKHLKKDEDFCTLRRIDDQFFFKK